jgi:hypothetical protein
VLVLIFKVELNVGRPEAGLKLAVAPEGNPEQLNDTDCEVPCSRLAVTVKVGADPAAILRDEGDFVTLKSISGAYTAFSVPSEVMVTVVGLAVVFETTTLPVLIQWSKTQPDGALAVARPDVPNGNVPFVLLRYVCSWKVML